MLVLGEFSCFSLGFSGFHFLRDLVSCKPLYSFIIFNESNCFFKKKVIINT